MLQPCTLEAWALCSRVESEWALVHWGFALGILNTGLGLSSIPLSLTAFMWTKNERYFPPAMPTDERGRKKTSEKYLHNHKFQRLLVRPCQETQSDFSERCCYLWPTWGWWGWACLHGQTGPAHWLATLAHTECPPCGPREMGTEWSLQPTQQYFSQGGWYTQ